MSYQTGSASDAEDLMTKLDTFLTANGWTQDDFDTTDDQSAYTRSDGTNSCSVQFHWDNTDDIAIFQSTSHDGSAPGSNPNDSGNIAAATGAITTGAKCGIGNNTGWTYHFFESDYYFYVAIEASTGVWRFFGAGIVTKLGSWTGGAFAFATVQDGFPQSANSTGTALICDALYNVTNMPNSCCVHAEGLPGQGASERWLVWGKALGGGTDGNGQTRRLVHGGSRTGAYIYSLGHYDVSLSQGFIPLIPIPVWYLRQDTTPDIYHPLGEIPDLRQINIHHLEPEQELVVGADTWIIFPLIAKSDTMGQVQPHSGYAGYAIKKVTT